MCVCCAYHNVGLMFSGYSLIVLYGPLVLPPVCRSHTAGSRGRGIDVGKGMQGQWHGVGHGTGTGKDRGGNNQ